MIFEERRDLTARELTPLAKTGDEAIVQPCERAVAAGPDAAVSRGEHRGHLWPAQSLSGRHGDDWGVGESIDAFRGRHPDVAFAIFHHAGDRVIRQSVRVIKMIDDVADDA